MFEPLIVPGSLDSLQAISDYIERAANKAKLDEKRRYLLKLATDEIATNIVVHGYIEAKLKGDIQVQIELTEEYLRITLIDSGEEYNPLLEKLPEDLEKTLEERAVGALGVYLALKAVDKFDYLRDEQWNKNIFTIYLDEAREAQLIQSDAALNSVALSEGEENSVLIVSSRKGEGCCKRLTHMLEALNCEFTMGDQSTAKEELKSKYFNIILLDVGSIEDLKLVGDLKRDADFFHIPIIALVPKDNEKLIDYSLHKGVDDYLSKDCSLHQFEARLSSCVYKNKMQQQLKSELQYMKKLVKVGIALSAEKDFEHLLFTILSEAKSICNADGGTLYIREKDTLKFAIILNDTLKISRIALDETTSSFPPLLLYDPKTGKENTDNVASYVALHQRSINISNVYADTQFDFKGTKDFDKANNYRTLSSLTVSLTNHENEAIGVLQLINMRDSKTNEKIAFNAQIQQLVEAFASQGAVILNTRILLERQKDLFRYERELQIGFQIQSDFLPKSLPRAIGWEISACFTPAHEVAGDFYDAFFLNKKKTIAVIIADVADKGVGAALFMALFRTLIRALSKREETDVDVLINTVIATNAYILENHMKSNMFATLFFGQFDIETGLLKYVNAGHNAPIILGGSGVKARLDSTGPALGMFPDASFEQKSITIEPGEFLFTFTDGVTEAKNVADEFYTEKKLLRLLSKPPDSAAKLLMQVEKSVKQFVGEAEQFDDITMLAVRRGK